MCVTSYTGHIARSPMEELLQEGNAPSATGARAAALRELARHLWVVEAHPVHELPTADVEAITHLVVEIHRDPPNN
mgnify:CR=1 FL=1